MTTENPKRKRRGLRAHPAAQAIQGNFDHLMGLVKSLSHAHNVVVDDLENLAGGVDVVTQDVAGKADTGHNHDHGGLTGLSGDHDAEYINESQAAGGDLSGTYPNPSVVDDSHSHGAGTAPGAGGSALEVSENGASVDAAVVELDFQDPLVATEPVDHHIEVALDESLLGHDHDGVSGGGTVAFGDLGFIPDIAVTDSGAGSKPITLDASPGMEFGSGFTVSDRGDGQPLVDYDPIAGSTRTQYIWLTPHQVGYDDATLGSTGTSPDIVGQTVHAEASGRTGFFGSYLVPGDWKAGTPITLAILWYSSSVSGNMVWTLSEQELETGQSPSAAAGAGDIAAVDTTVADSATVKLTTLDTTFTPTAAGNLIKVNVERKAAAAGDTATGAGRVLAVRMAYTAEGIQGPQGDPGAAGANTIIVQKSDVDVDTAAATVDFDGTDFEVSSSPSGEANISIPTTADGAFRKSIRAGKRMWVYTEAGWFMGAAVDESVDGFTVSTPTAGSISSVTGVAGHPGISGLSSGSSSSGVGRCSFGNITGFLIGSGVVRVCAWVRIPTVSDGTNAFRCFVGFHNQTAMTRSSGEALGFWYKHDVNSGAWEAVATHTGSETPDILDDNGGSVTVVANDWYKLEIVLNAAGSSADFYINDVLKGTLASGMPTGGLGIHTAVVKTIGTSARIVQLDAMLIDHTPTTPR